MMNKGERLRLHCSGKLLAQNGCRPLAISVDTSVQSTAESVQYIWAIAAGCKNFCVWWLWSSLIKCANTIFVSVHSQSWWLQQACTHTHTQSFSFSVRMTYLRIIHTNTCSTYSYCIISYLILLLQAMHYAWNVFQGTINAQFTKVKRVLWTLTVNKEKYLYLDVFVC